MADYTIDDGSSAMQSALYAKNRFAACTCCGTRMLGIMNTQDVRPIREVCYSCTKAAAPFNEGGDHVSA